MKRLRSDPLNDVFSLLTLANMKFPSWMVSSRRAIAKNGSFHIAMLYVAKYGEPPNTTATPKATIYPILLHLQSQYRE